MGYKFKIINYYSVTAKLRNGKKQLSGYVWLLAPKLRKYNVFNFHIRENQKNCVTLQLQN